MNIRYWNTYYKKFNLNKPSNFARFCFKYFSKKDISIDVGCGNGRDTNFFITKGLNFQGLDTSITAIKINKKKIGNYFLKKNLCSKSFKSSSLEKKKLNNVYARFFLHTITKKNQNIFFENLKKILRKNGKVFLEFRTIKDPMAKLGKKISFNETITSHYRRFIVVKDLERELKLLNFKIIYKKQSFNFAKLNKQKPHICRMILIKC